MTTVKDKEYWESYYKEGNVPKDPSLFAKFVLSKYIKAGERLFELGCGNGRDAHYFAQNGVYVEAIDQCEIEIETLKISNGKIPNLSYISGDFTALPKTDKAYNAIYSRFTLHSVTEQDQNKTLEWSFDNLSNGGFLCIETRGKKNEIYRKGRPVNGQSDAYVYEGHYRRFVNFDDFVHIIQHAGFNVLEAFESTGIAPYNGTDYHFIRLIAQKG